MSAPFVAEIRIFACNFAPTGWATCDGQTLSISQNTALFSLLGTMYGGDGKSNFKLPNMQGNVALGTGQSTTGTDYFEGQEGGSSTITLLTSEMPVHPHTLQGTAGIGNLNNAPPNLTARPFGGGSPYLAPGGATTQMAIQAVAPAGSDQPHNNMQPYLVLLFCIALQGVFPPRP